MQDVADISHLINITMQDADIFTFNNYNYARCCRYIHI